MVDKHRVQSLLERYGEIIVVTDAGVKYELHGDVEFLDGEDQGTELHFDSGDEMFWIDAEAIESVKVHKSHEMGGI